MDQETEPDRSLISTLPDDVLTEIISNLSVKKATETSILSKRWRNLYRKMKNIVINKSEFVKTKRVSSFVRQMLIWVSRLSVKFIESFELHIPKPKASEATINLLISIAVEKRVKNLVLDFSDPVWETSDLVENHQFLINLPDCMYNQTHIESLKLYACGINSTSFKKSTALRSFTIGWLQISEVTALLSKFPSLESLRFINCASLGVEEMVFGEDQNRLRELVFKDCDFADPVCEFDIPKAVIFKYSGTVPYFSFRRVNEQMQEAYLDFDLATTYTIATGELLAYLVCHLSYAKTLTVCSYLLQVYTKSFNLSNILHSSSNS